jgi:hypothetical protein
MVDIKDFITDPYDNGFLEGRKTLKNLSVSQRDEGFLIIEKDKDQEMVFVGTYAKLKEHYPQLEV